MSPPPARHTGHTADDEAIPAIGYVRVSTWREEKISPELQRASVEGWARRSGRVIVDWVEDLDATGTNFRRKIINAIERVERGEVREIVVWKYSRFGRDRHGVALNLARIEKAGGQLQSATEEADATTATGWFHRDMLFSVAGFESKRAGEQWIDAMDHRRAQKLPASGGRRFGYIWHPRTIPDGQGGFTTQEEKYVVDPDTGPIAADLYRRHVDGEGFYRLAGWLNEHGYYSPRTGKPWGLNALIYYMDAGFPAGKLWVHRRDLQCGTRNKCTARRAHYTHIDGAQPALVDPELWQQYLDRRARNAKLPPRSRKPTYPLTGLVRCGHCGRSAIPSNGNYTTGYAYRCSGRAHHGNDCKGAYVRRSIVEKRVHEWLGEVADEIDAQSAGTEIQPPAPAVDPGIERARLAKEADKLQHALDSASEAYALGDIPRDSYLRTRDRLQQRMTGLEKQIEEAAADADRVRGPAPFTGVVQTLLSEWDTLAVSVKRDLLATLLARVEILSDEDGRRARPVPVWPTAE
ncbi:recombinase family protein [Streptomyces sp. DSM 42041]|uniref:Recombinase family protein n=1 Tax=Streptomyces hazeniae TaxID=3075538 RepID=A0ABU2NWK1_9ACTN|nr:recombinase family protein [Streptomyces sp. DSM 42041]MDT0381369.1 recombinase family protein [Streptomyces sp. DSM 42041]